MMRRPNPWRISFRIPIFLTSWLRERLGCIIGSRAARLALRVYSIAYAMQGYFGDVSGSEPFYKARSAAQKALQLDSQIPESHIALALLDYIYFWNFREAEDELRQALALDPNSTYAHAASCWFYADIGRVRDMLPDR